MEFWEVGTDMRMTIWAFMLALSMISTFPQRALGQVARPAIGTAVGIAGGAVITLSIVVARARFQEIYLDSAEDLIHWQSAPMLLTPAVGLTFGLAGPEALKGSVIGSTSGMLVGTAVGAGIGWITSADPEAPWAGGVIGAGVGMTLGGLGFGIRNWIEHRNDRGGDAFLAEEGPRVEFRIPL